jgi:lactoylglutathione lyase
VQKVNRAERSAIRTTAPCHPQCRLTKRSRLSIQMPPQIRTPGAMPPNTRRCGTTDRRHDRLHLARCCASLRRENGALAAALHSAAEPTIRDLVTLTGTGDDAGERAMAVLQMRLVVEAKDYDEAVAFYRDALGAPEELFVDSGDGARVTILDVGRATLELSTPEQVELIDRAEVGRRVSPRLRVAFEVADAEAATRQLTEAGAQLVAPPTVTPWNSLNSRLQGPAGLQLTLFQEQSSSADEG